MKPVVDYKKGPVDRRELQQRALREARELVSAPEDTSQRRLWEEERRGAAVLLAGLADWDGTRLRRAALGIADSSDVDAQSLLIEAALIADDEARYGVVPRGPA